MTKDKKIDLQKVDTGYRTPDGDYQASIDKHLARLSLIKITKDETTFTRKYTVGNMKYTVRSVFPRTNTSTADDNLKHLMAREAENAS